MPPASRLPIAARGLAFESADREAFRRSLGQTGFYRDWKEKFGPDAWKALESVTGALA